MNVRASQTAEIRARAEACLAVDRSVEETLRLSDVLARDVLALCDLLAKTQEHLQSKLDQHSREYSTATLGDVLKCPCDSCVADRAVLASLAAAKETER